MFVLSMARPAGLSDEDSDEDFGLACSSNAPRIVPSQMAAQSSIGGIGNFRRQPSGWTVGCSDLQAAILQCRLDTVMALTTSGGVSVNQVFSNGLSPLMSACTKSSVSVAKYLVDNGADVHFTKDGISALSTACSSAHYTDEYTCILVEILLAAGAGVNTPDRHRCTPLLFAARCGKFDAVRRLLRAGAKVDVPDTMGWTPLMHAASRAFGHIVRCLLEAGADTDIYNINGQTASDLADSEGFHIISDLLKRKIPTTAIDKVPAKEVSQTKLTESLAVCGELEMALFSMELSHLIPVFHEHNVDFTCFLRLDAADLDRMNITKVGDRSRLLDGIREIHTQEWQRTSLPALHYRKYLTRADIGALVDNVAQHIKLIHASVGYVRDQVTEHDDILQLATDEVKISVLKDSSVECICHLRGLLNELQLFTRYLRQVEGRVELQSVGEVNDKVVSRSRCYSWVTCFVPFTVATGTVLVLWRYCTPRFLAK